MGGAALAVGAPRMGLIGRMGPLGPMFWGVGRYHAPALRLVCVDEAGDYRSREPISPIGPICPMRAPNDLKSYKIIIPNPLSGFKKIPVSKSIYGYTYG